MLHSIANCETNKINIGLKPLKNLYKGLQHTQNTSVQFEIFKNIRITQDNMKFEKKLGLLRPFKF